MTNFDKARSPVQHVCPQCGYVLGEIAAFQIYEYKVATWLMGQVAPAFTKGFDVYRCHDLDDLTFQVKVAHARYAKRGDYTNPNGCWMWYQKRNEAEADYYVFCGLAGDHEEWFLLNRSEFIGLFGKVS